MFILRWLQWLYGWVRWRAEGGSPERLLNLTAQQRLSLWGVQRKAQQLYACCPAKQYRRLRAPARRTGMRVRVVEKHGFPFWLRRHSARMGVAAGVLVFAVLIQLLSRRTWVIQVRGNDTVDAQEILAVMSELGVEEGRDLSQLDINTLQLEVLRRLPTLAWCTVNLKGSVAYVDVDERVPRPELTTEGVPSNIKAACDGRILSVEAYTGQAMVQKGDAVTQGMLLISGVVDSKAGPILRRAQGRVIAETTHTLTVEVPLHETQWLPTQHTIDRVYLRFFSWEIPCFTSGEITLSTEQTVTERRLTVNGVSLPIGWRRQAYTVLAETPVSRTAAEAQALAEQRLAQQQQDKLAAATIVSCTRQGGVIGDRYVLTATYLCHESIGVEQPLMIQGAS